MLAERVDQRKRHLALVITPVRRIERHVAQAVVHPAHVPLQPETQAAQVRRTAHRGPARRFLRDGHDPRELPVGDLVETLEEIHRLQVLASAELVGHPLARLARVIEIEHGGHGIHAQAVDVVVVQPEQAVGGEEIAHLVAAVVEDERAPVGVLTLARVAVFVEVRAVEIRQAVGVLREMARHPVEDHADAALVALVHEIAELVRVAEPAGGRVVIRDLIAPRAVEGMLGHGHEFDVGETHLDHVIDEMIGQFAVGQRAVVILGHALPTARVDLVDAHGGFFCQSVARRLSIHSSSLQP